MASIQQVQAERVLSAIAQRFYSSGANPTLDQILAQVSKHFAQYPAGLPLPFPLDLIQYQSVADVDSFNLLLAHLSANIEVLYEVCLDQVDELMMLSTLLTADLDRLTVRRKRVETQIDDYLLSLYNSDSYYLSRSDSFADTSLTDLNLTSAFVDTSHNNVVLPTISNLSQIIGAGIVGNPTIRAWVTVGNVQQSAQFNTISPFHFATNGASNTVWEIQVITNVPSEVVVAVEIPLGTTINPVRISRAEFSPYGITPIQVYAEAGVPTTANTVIYSGFGTSIQTGLSRMSFVDKLTELSAFRFTLRKTQYDYTDNNGGALHYHYVFGAKEIVFSEQVYDSSATFVSEPLQIDPGLQNDMVIDAVSLATVDSIPADTSIFYYVAEDPMISATPSLGDLIWRQIEPVGTQKQDAAVVVRFDGAQAFEKMITNSPGVDDLQLVPLDGTIINAPGNSDPAQRNPCPVIIPATDVYILARNFTDTPLLNSLSLEEGVNSTRIYWTAYNSFATNDLSFWGNFINGMTPPQVQYGRIDVGNGFFYGGDIGQNGISVFVETFLQLDSPSDPLLAMISKADSNSQTWTVRAFLNGRSISSLPGRNIDTFSVSATPSGFETVQDSALVPFAFQQGLNHIGVAINIPPPTLTLGVQNPYLGTLELSPDQPLFGLGTVKLSDWAYVNLFDMSYNETGQPPTFTITSDGTIISRRRTTTNYRLRYNTATSTGPPGIRVRADLERSTSNMNVTPSISNYQLRFSYGTS